MPFHKGISTMTRRVRIYDASDPFDRKFIHFAQSLDEAEEFSGCKKSTIRYCIKNKSLTKKNKLSIALAFK